MKTHIFQARTMAAAVAQVKAHLGPDALILRTRTLRKGGLFNRSRGKLIEITAAWDGPPAPTEFHRAKRRQGLTPTSATKPSRVPLPSLNVPDWLEQDKPAETTRLRDDRLRPDRRPEVAGNPQSTETSRQVERLFRSFMARHVTESLVQQLLADLPGEADLTHPQQSDHLLERIEKLIPTAGPVQPGLPGKPRIVSFVGPTGVGKTTTIAKLAAQYKLQHNVSVALLTIDTYRIAAVDQLRTYADIIDVPFSVVLSPDELSRRVSRLSDYSLIFIDTTGRSPNNDLRLAELRSFHQALGSHQTHLVLAATAAYPQLIAAVEKFSPLGIDQLLLTKLDEVVSLSPVLNVFARLASGQPAGCPIPLSYITAGQDVPDDIEVASARSLAARILEEHRD